MHSLWWFKSLRIAKTAAAAMKKEQDKDSNMSFMKWRHPCREILRKTKKGRLSLIAEIAAAAVVLK